MELSRKEEYRNQKVSIGVTLLSFIVMLLFFIYTNVITANSSASSSFNSAEMLFEVSSGGDNDYNTPAKAAALTASKQENTSEKIQTVNSDVVLKNAAQEIVDRYKTTNYTNTTVNESKEERIFSENAYGEKERRDFGKIGLTNSLGYDLNERVILFKPNFTNSTNEQGNVVVEIVVDKSGTVIEATPNGRGTTTNSSHLKEEARKIALATKFSENQKRDEQKGTITIIFSFK